MDEVTQRKIGSIAKQKSWFKRIDLGELSSNIVFDSWEQIAETTKLKSVVTALMEWVIGNDRS